MPNAKARRDPDAGNSAWLATVRFGSKADRTRTSQDWHIHGNVAQTYYSPQTRGFGRLGRPMKLTRLLFLATGGAIVLPCVSFADSPPAVVRALRRESNAAIAAHDVRRLRAVLDDAYLGIEGTSGTLDSGGESTARSYGEQEFRDPTFVTYRRTPESIVMAQSGKRIAETGHWVGIWRKPDGTMRTAGIYLAVWIPSGTGWRLKSETFVTLSCTGSADCKKSD